MGMKRISKQYFRDTKCTEIESRLRENPNFSGWIVKRIKSSGGVSDFEDSFEIQNEKGRRILELTESELDLVIAKDMLEWILENRLRLGFLAHFGPRGIWIAIIMIFVIPIVAIIPIFGFIHGTNEVNNDRML